MSIDDVTLALFEMGCLLGNRENRMPEVDRVNQHRRLADKILAGIDPAAPLPLLIAAEQLRNDPSQYYVIVAMLRAAGDDSEPLIDSAANLLLAMQVMDPTSEFPKTKGKISRAAGTTSERARRGWEQLKRLGYYNSKGRSGVYLTVSGKKRAVKCTENL